MGVSINLTSVWDFITKLLLALLLSSWALDLRAQTVYLRPEEALRLAFKDSEEVVSEKRILQEADKTKIEKVLGSPLARQEWNFYIARTRRKIDGYALIDNEVGKTEPITFLAVISPTGEVREVEILVYREPIGSEVRGKGFLRQFRGKRVTDPVRVGGDIKNMTGATMSSRAVSRGVKRALLLWEVFYGK